MGNGVTVEFPRVEQTRWNIGAPATGPRFLRAVCTGPIMVGVVTRRIPGGDAGTLATLGHMRRLANRGVRDPLTVRVTGTIISGVLRNPAVHAANLRAWIARRFRFRRDPHGVELVREVREMLTDALRDGVATGDCDDAAVLAAAMGKAVGLKARYVALAFGASGAPFRHVYTELWNGRAWVEVDVTRPMQRIPPATRQLAVDV